MGSVEASSIRPASGEDLAALVEIHLASARYHAQLDPDFYAVPARDAVEAHLRARLESESRILVADVDGQPVGSVSVELRTPSADSMIRPVPTAWVGIAILEAWRGRGVGTALMRAAEEWAREQGAERVMLDASLTNVDALRFYEGIGYRRTGIILTKPLTGGSEARQPRDLGWREIAAIDARLERGEIDEEEWHAAMAALVVPAYLAAATPSEGSGKQGSAEDWEHARSHVADAIDRDGSFLDVGCANGYLLECLPRWSRYRLDRYGLDIAPELVDLARGRLPELADRLFVGNALHWEPPHRFTYVRTGLEYVPRHRRRELVERLLGWCERLIIGPMTEAIDGPTERLLVEWGHPPSGRSERPHRHANAVYRALWVDAR